METEICYEYQHIEMKQFKDKSFYPMPWFWASPSRFTSPVLAQCRDRIKSPELPQGRSYMSEARSWSDWRQDVVAVFTTVGE